MRFRRYNFKQKLAVVACLSLGLFVIPDLAQAISPYLDKPIDTVNSAIMSIGKYLSGF